ncbi:ATP-binding protein [Scleromatobacter humisilvae]|uniref:ATP-binding protein n=1 Tax=Scleromatobacter humisilvae TaxID=2897159 RepID=A0A9X2C4C0_9BURK|nr:ATP-binding protein [Scleromatobacter humisilvae]MCK9689090.1 ATP-binding protein [Scleromatobacter humisilvae]
MPAIDGTGAPLRVAIVGAESTGKSVLANALADALAREFGLRCAVVDEYLRTWCEEQHRTPRADEQMGIALEHARRIEAAGAQPGLDVLLCDTTPLMVAVYSDLLFDDRSLEPAARDCQQAMDLTLLTSLDLPWVADGLQRDGPHVRAPVDARVRARLRDWGVTWSVVSGSGDARTSGAIDALRPLLREHGRRERSTGLLSRLQASREGPPSPRWVCERCDDPFCERHPRPAGRAN